MKVINYKLIVKLFISCTIIILLFSCNGCSSDEPEPKPDPPIVVDPEPEEPENPLDQIDSTIQGDGSHKVISYLRAEKALEYLNDNHYDNLSHIIILTHPEVASDGHITISSALDEIFKQAILRRKSRKTKILIGVGGGNDFYIPLINDTTKLKNYITDIKDICIDYQLDGADLDWEHPETAEQHIAAGIFAKKAHELLKPEGLLLTQAIIWYNIGHMKAVVEYLNYINVMTYDNFDSNYYHSPYSQYETFINKILAEGLPKSKILGGLPFYGYNVVKDWNLKGGSAYYDILNKYNPKLGENAVTKPDGTVISFDGVVKIWKKCAYTLEKDLAGVMIFETWMDVPDFSSEKSLMRQVNNVFPIDNQ